MPRTKSYTSLHGDIIEVKINSIRFFGSWGEYVSIPLSIIEHGDTLEAEDDTDINVETWKCEQEGWTDDN